MSLSVRLTVEHRSLFMDFARYEAYTYTAQQRAAGINSPTANHVPCVATSTHARASPIIRRLLFMIPLGTARRKRSLPWCVLGCMREPTRERASPTRAFLHRYYRRSCRYNARSVSRYRPPIYNKHAPPPPPPPPTIHLSPSKDSSLYTPDRRIERHSRDISCAINFSRLSLTADKLKAIGALKRRSSLARCRDVITRYRYERRSALKRGRNLIKHPATRFMILTYCTDWQIHAHTSLW